MLEELAKALRKRIEIINDQELRLSDPQRHLAMLENISVELEQLIQALPQETSPRLMHFLKQASYSKALEFLDTNF